MKKVKENINQDYYICVLLLTTLVIFIQAFKRYTIPIFSYSISWSYFLLPVVLLINNFILKRYDYKKAVVSVAVSGIVSLSFNVIIAYFMNKNHLLTNTSGDFCGYIVSQFIHLLIYETIWNRNKCTFTYLYVSYISSIIVYFLFYNLIYLYLVLEEGFWIQFFLMIFIQAIICVPIVYFDLSLKMKKDTKKTTRFKFV